MNKRQTSTAKKSLASTSKGAPGWLVPLVCATVFLVITLAFAGPSWAIVLYRLVVDGGVVAIWLIAAAGLGWAIVGWFDDFRQDLALHAAAAAGLGLGLISLATLGLGLAGGLNRGSAIALLALGWIGGAIEIVGRRRLFPSPGTPGEGRGEGGFQTPSNSAVKNHPHPNPLPEYRERGPEQHRYRWLWLAVMPIAAIVVVGAIVPPGVLWNDEPHWYDVVEYHLQVPREWFEASRIVPLHHNVFSYFPFNVEMHYLLAMHLRGGPWAGMYVAQLMHVAMCALAVVAVYGVVGGVKGTIAGVIMAATPWVTLVAPVAYVEGGLLLYGTLTIGLALRAIKKGPAARPRVFFLAGLMSGFACGVKLTAMPWLLVPIPVALLICRAGLKRPAIFLVAGLLSFSPWLIRNIVWTGNPVFPEAMSLLGKGHFSDVQVERWRRAYLPDANHASAVGRIKALGEQVIWDWRYGWVLLPLAVVALVIRRTSSQITFLAILLGVLTVVWLCFTHLQSRFFVLAVPIGAIAIAQVDGRAWAIVSASVAIVLAAISGIGNGVRLNQQALEPDRKLAAEGGSGWLGIENPSFAVPLDVDDLLKHSPPDGRLVLVGDAMAFRWTVPMSRLRYRTVFDLDTSDGSLSAWVQESKLDEAYAKVFVIAPVELERFHKTYWKIPALEERWVRTLPGNVRVEQ